MLEESIIRLVTIQAPITAINQSNILSGSLLTNSKRAAIKDGPAINGTARGTLLAFVTDSENEAAQDNTIVTWNAESGVTLDSNVSATGDYLLTSRKHNATNFYEVTVDYPISEVIGIWAYADSGNNNNYWEEEFGSIDGNTITVRIPFAFCDQLLRITYITSGCAVNYITAGSTSRDVRITADVEGSSYEI